MARVQHQVSGFEESFYHAQEALSGFLANEDRYLDRITDAVALAADLACATLRDNKAEEILSKRGLESLKEKESISLSEIHILCLSAEIALDQNQEVKAAEISNYLVSKGCEHPRSLVLQSRIINRQGNQEEAQTKYITALDAWKNLVIGERTYSTAVEIAFGKTAQDLQFWGESEKHFQHAVEQSPTEKRALMKLARSYVKSAEARRFSEVLKAIRRVPNHQAISSKNFKSFQECIAALAQVEVAPELIKKLQARGEAVFSPNQESAEILKGIAETPDEIAALIGAYRNSRQKVFATQVALDNLTLVGQDAYHDGQIALALLKMKPEAAYKAASGALEAAKRSNSPQLPLFFTLHAIASKEINDKVSAYESIQKALQLWSDEPRWYALAAEMSPEYPDAVDYYHKAIELEPEYAHHHLALGKLHLAAKQSIPAVKSFEKAISLKPDYIDAWIQLALGKRSMHRLPEALSTIKKALTLAPDHTEAKKTAALLSFEKGNYRESENHLVALLGQNPNDTDLLALFARTLTAQKQPDQALNVIDKAISLEEDPLELKLQRARMIKDINGSLAAIDELRILGSHYPDQYPLILELVSTLAEAGEVDQAVRTAQDALQGETYGYSPEQQAHLFLLTGRLLRKSGQLDQAVHHLYKAKKLVSPNYQAALELGRVHSDRRQYDQALDQTKKAIEIEPDEPEGYYQAGRILKELKQFDRAERMLRKASKLAPHDLKIHRQLGVLVTLNLVHGEKRKEVPV
jgi:tetratricopeptide (TPR) repeat protein